MNAHAMLTRLPIGNLAVAKALAEEGFHIFPCQSAGAQIKRPCPGLRWRAESTTDQRRLEMWWRRWPDALPAIDLAKSRALVIDADRHGGPDGVNAWTELAGEHEGSPPMVETPSGGRHYYYRQPDGPEFTNARGTLPKGIDVRGSGGYVIAPGAILPDGRTYALTGDMKGAGVVPGWLGEILKAKPEALDRPQGATLTAIPGGRGDGFFRNVNDFALANIEAFARAMFGRLVRFHPGTGSWRVSSHALGRKLQEDISLNPQGIQDFGEECTLTAIDVVMRFKEQPDAMSAALWICEQLGVTPHSLGLDEANSALEAQGAEIAARLAEAARGGADHIEPKEAEIVAEQGQDGADHPVDFPDSLTHPGGLVGDMVDWIEATARYPNRPMALAGALSALGAAMGREWAGPTESSTTLYTLVLAPTGAGKDHVIEQIARLMSRAKMGDIIGPDDFQSANAMSSLVQRKPLTLCIMDEFGSFLARISHKNASSFSRDTSAFLRKMWSIKFKLYRSSEYAQRQSVNVWAPAFNLLGVSVPKEFYAALKGQDVANGFFNRFFVISTQSKPVEREPLRKAGDIPQELVRQLEYAMSRGRLSDSKRCPDTEVYPSFVTWGEGGQRADQDLKDEIAMRIEADPDALDLYVRTREMAIRIATIAGFGKSMKLPLIDGETMHWAGQVALWSCEQMIAQFREYSAENDTQALAKEILRHIRINGGITHSNLIRKLDYRFRTAEVKGMIEMLVTSGDVLADTKKNSQGGRPTLSYRLGPVRIVT